MFIETWGITIEFCVLDWLCKQCIWIQYVHVRKFKACLWHKSAAGEDENKSEYVPSRDLLVCDQRFASPYASIFFTQPRTTQKTLASIFTAVKTSTRIRNLEFVTSGLEKKLKKSIQNYLNHSKVREQSTSNDPMFLTHCVRCKWSLTRGQKCNISKNVLEMSHFHSCLSSVFMW